MVSKYGNVLKLALVSLIIVSYLLPTAYFFQPLHYQRSALIPLYHWTDDGILTFLPQIATVGVSLEHEPRLYGSVREADLPWFAHSSVNLNDLRTKYGANRFITAFRTTMPQPLLEEEYNVAIAAQYIAGQVVEPQTVFSLNRAIGPRTKQRGFGPGPIYQNGGIGSTLGGGICKVATTLYNVAIQADLPIVERHNHSMLVPYVPAGRDATILWGVKDLRFLNDKDHPLIVWAEVKGNSLYIALYGRYDPPLIEWSSEELGRTPTWTIRRRNPNLSAGETHTITGAAGLTVRTWITVDYPSIPTYRKNLGVDHYRPLPTYLEYGT